MSEQEMPEMSEAQRAIVDALDPALVEKAKKLNMNYWNFGSDADLEHGINRFLEANPAEAKLLEEEGEADV